MISRHADVDALLRDDRFGVATPSPWREVIAQGVPPSMRMLSKNCCCSSTRRSTRGSEVWCPRPSPPAGRGTAPAADRDDRRHARRARRRAELRRDRGRRRAVLDHGDQRAARPPARRTPRFAWTLAMMAPDEIPMNFESLPTAGQAARRVPRLPTPSSSTVGPIPVRIPPPPSSCSIHGDFWPSPAAPAGTSRRPPPTRARSRSTGFDTPHCASCRWRSRRRGTPHGGTNRLQQLKGSSRARHSLGVGATPMRKIALPLTLASVAGCLLFSATRPAVARAANSAGSLTSIGPRGESGGPCPLKHTDVKADISGLSRASP